MSHPVPPPGPASSPGANDAPQAPYRADAPQSAAAQRAQQPTTLAYTNTFALVAVILGFLQPIAGIVFGHLALGQIKRNGDTGRGLALTGLIVGYVMVAFWVAFIVFYVVVIFSMIAGFGSMMSSFSDPYYS